MCCLLSQTVTLVETRSYVRLKKDHWWNIALQSRPSRKLVITYCKIRSYNYERGKTDHKVARIGTVLLMPGLSTMAAGED